jgi:CxxC motif-containing protein (DUF1111 family)
MKQPYRAWYVLVALLALAPVGMRALTWPAARQHTIDPALAQAGKMLFKHDWRPGDPLSPGGDGLGPVFNATSCVECHAKGGLGGSGELRHNVTTFTVRSGGKDGGQVQQGVVHARAVKVPQETLNHVHSTLQPIARPTLAQLVSLPGSKTQPLSFPSGVHLSQRNTPALFGAKLIDEIPDRVIIANERAQSLRWGLAPPDGDAPVGRALRLADGRVGRFGWKAQSASLADFVQAACANELGLGNPGQAQPRPLGRPDYQAPGMDLTTEQCNQMTTFIASLPRPLEQVPSDSAAQDRAHQGKKLFRSIGCASCHTPDLGSVEGLYSDLLLHPMGHDLQGGGSYHEPMVEIREISSAEGPQPGEWRTPPLWGVADSAPYLHDGRAATLEDAIRLHGGQGARAANRFAQLSTGEQAQLLAFLKGLRAPRP